MRLLILLIASASVWGATVTASGNGLWASGGTWVGGVAPASGDTAVIPDGITVTAAATATVAIVNTNCSGIVAVTGGTFTATTFNFTGSTSCATSALTAAAGTTIHIDTYAPSSGTGFRYPTFTGTSGSHVTVGPRGTYAQYYGGLQAIYTDFSNIGDATHAGFSITSEYSGSHLAKWDSTYNTFTACGDIVQLAGSGLDATAYYDHSYNVHTASASANSLSNAVSLTTRSGVGYRNMVGNVFDGKVVTYPANFTIYGNYFGGNYSASPFSAAWDTWQNNFIRTVDGSAAGQDARGSMLDTYYLLDIGGGNPRGIYMPSDLSVALSGWIIDHDGDTTTGTNDSGEFMVGHSDAAVTWTMQNSIMLANMRGYSSWEAVGITGTFTQVQPNLLHNTWFGGYEGAGAVSNMLQINEGGNNALHQILAMKSNLIWNPMLASYTPTAFYKIFSQNPTTPQVDVCDPTACDYNAGWNVTASSGNPNNTNAGKGYDSKWSATPGAHDISGSPSFVDYARNVALFDSKYLGNAPAAWSSGTTYALGAMVSNTRSDMYWGNAVNFRCIQAAGCSTGGGTNHEPGNGDAWRTDWEFASLYRIRTAIAAGTTYTVPSLGVWNQDIIALLVRWVQAGYAPQNAAYAGAGHDGLDIGAVAYAATTAAPPAATGTMVQGAATMKGAVIR